MNGKLRLFSFLVRRPVFRLVLLMLFVCTLLGGQIFRAKRAESAAATGAWISAGAMNAARRGHTATLLPDGRLLVASGLDGNLQPIKGAELYDSVTDRWTLTGELNEPHDRSAAVLLKDGRALLVGRQSAETYDPATGKWTLTGDMALKGVGAARYEGASVTLLADGRVLVAGGYSGSLSFARPGAELFDPATGKWTVTGSMNFGRNSHAAALLPNGKVLVIGGIDRTEIRNIMELYDPATGKWTTMGSPKVPRSAPTIAWLPNGTLLVAGASTDTGREVEIYDPANGTWRFTGSLNFGGAARPMTVLPGGKILRASAHTEIYDPGTERWTVLADPLFVRGDFYTLTTLADGRALVVGGLSGGSMLRNAEFFDPAGSTAPGVWIATGELGARRQSHTATLLQDGTVLIAGGGWQLSDFAKSGIQSSASIFDSAQGMTQVAPLGTPRQFHTATLLPNGQVLVVGGELAANTTLLSAELFDPATKTWQPAAPLSLPKRRHTATLLNNGKVLVAGGDNDGIGQAGAELYDPATNRWATTGSLGVARRDHTATLLTDGKVLVVGGENNGAAVINAELYDPATGAWTAAGVLSSARRRHTATRLLDGRVLVIGGSNETFPALTEIFDPATGQWKLAGVVNVARENHTATLLADGRVLVAGGAGEEGQLISTEIFDPAANDGAGEFVNTGPLKARRELHTATALPDGRVIAAGGVMNSGSSRETLYDFEIFDPLAGSTVQQPPRITPVSASTYRGGDIATESIVAVFGEHFTNSTVVANATPLPTTLGGVRVAIRRSGGDLPLSLFFVSPNQVNCLISTPVLQQIAPGALTMVLTTSDGATITEPINIVPVAPGLFSADASGTGLASAVVLRVKANGEQVYEPVAQFDQTQNRFVAAPIDLGNTSEQVFLILYGTGIRFRSSLAGTSANVGGVPAEISYAGPQGNFVGLDQINLRLPRSLTGRGEVAVQVSADGITSNTVKVAVK